MSGAASCPASSSSRARYRTRPEPVRRRLAVGRRRSSSAIRRCRRRRCSPCCASGTPGATRRCSCARLQRQIATWRAQHGPSREVIFPQVHRPGDGRPVRLHPHGRPGRHAGRRAVPAPALPPGARLLECRSGPDLLLGELRGAGRRDRALPLAARRRAPRSTAPIISSAAIRPLDADGRAPGDGALRRADAPLRAGADHQQRSAWRTRTATSSRPTTASRRPSTRRCACAAAASSPTAQPTRASSRSWCSQRNLTRQARWAEEQRGAAAAAGDAAGAVPRAAGAGQPLQHHPGAAQHLLGALAADRHDACWCGCAPRRWRSTAARRTC